ncbi:MAG: HAMP domain-containing histidine kinase [Bacteroidales bacterium]|nr:HAMP domain-containing histidine kinase [Bacteroidales bacterium]
MKRKAIVLLIVLTSVSLVGIVFTQLYWVKKSLDLKTEQFDNSVRIAMKSVLNQLMDIKNDSVFQQNLLLISCRKSKLDATDIIQPELLDSLLLLEMKCMALNENFNYGLYNKRNGRFVAGRFAGAEHKLLDSPFQFSVASLYKPGDYYLSTYFSGKTGFVLQQMEVWLLFSVLFLVVLIISFIWVAYTILRQKKLSEMKTDFINNLTHEFKTPIATSSLAAEMLLRPEINYNVEKIKKYAGVILDENQRLQGHVEQVLQVAILEKGGQRFKFRRTNIHELLLAATESFDLRIKKNKIKLNIELEADRQIVVADKVHILNVFHNMLDNAIKYSPVNPKIQIKTWNTNKHIVIRFKDNGIGIHHEHQKDIFKNLFRVPMGNIHDVRGFGLGLYYVKTVIDQHNGRTEVKSELGKGSKFYIFLPFNDGKLKV